MSERYALVDTAGVAVALPPDTRPGTHSAAAPAIRLERARGYTEFSRIDDRLGTPQPVVLTWREEAATEAELEARLRMYRSAARTAVWLTRAGRSALPVLGGHLDSRPVQDEYSNVADVTLTLAPGTTAASGTDGQEVVW
ncbi:hypothetical protein DEIPH_ctg041orf0019 [Deinococcus phoenicis]|uniref:Uncharacterized protein n=1 Tax=Deinococcus phoenicis TaxID=1476583 RepID=A0A016QMP6_9DEIO|nr:hypothetical protein [Deinococcus phoenicis]EYB67420.1 hypothetical protein DEIPH_ctg041orf0019 [Deinococcus phoenicis]